MNRNKLLAIANLIALALVMLVNSLSISLPINGYSTVELSDSYPNLFVPAGQTFSIWGIIYLSLIIFTVIEVVRAFRNEQDTPTSRIGILFLVSCAANAGWIFTWHYLLVELSVLCMISLLVSLILIYQKLNPSHSGTEKWTSRLPFSIYLGWICIALIANITALLVHYGWSDFGLGAQNWVLVLILIGLAIGLIFLLKNNDPFLALTISWAFYGIYLKRSADLAEPVQSIITLSIAACIILVIASSVQVLRKRSIYQLK